MGVGRDWILACPRCRQEHLPRPLLVHMVPSCQEEQNPSAAVHREHCEKPAELHIIQLPPSMLAAMYLSTEENTGSMSLAEMAESNNSIHSDCLTEKS